MRTDALSVTGIATGAMAIVSGRFDTGQNRSDSASSLSPRFESTATLPPVFDATYPCLQTYEEKRMKTAVALRHLAFEDLGLLEPWLLARGWRVQYHDVGVDCLSELTLHDIDLLAVLGGPIGAEDDALYPYLADEVGL